VRHHGGCDNPRMLDEVATHAERRIPASQVVTLYRAQGWWPERTLAQVDAVLDTGPVVGAWRGDRLVGFARAVTDGVLRAYLEDVIVAPDLRGTGVGRALVSAILDQLRPIPVVSLFCSAELATFYEAAGFHSTRQTVLHLS
jgi:GNAT superfamily N-acetyltransferase